MAKNFLLYGIATIVGKDGHNINILWYKWLRTYHCVAWAPFKDRWRNVNMHMELKNLPTDAVVGSSYLGKDGQNIKTWLKN